MKQCQLNWYPPALFPEPGATPPAPTGAVALGSFLWRRTDGRRLRGGSRVGRTGRLGGRESHNGSVHGGAGGGVRSAQDRGAAWERASSGGRLCSGQCRRVRERPPRALGRTWGQPASPTKGSTPSGRSPGRRTLQVCTATQQPTLGDFFFENTFKFVHLQQPPK